MKENTPTPSTENQNELNDIQLDNKLSIKEKESFKKLNEQLDKPEEAAKLKESLSKQLEEKFKIWEEINKIKDILKNDKASLQDIAKITWWKGEKIWLIQLYVKLQWGNPGKIDWVMWKNTLQWLKEINNKPSQANWEWEPKKSDVAGLEEKSIPTASTEWPTANQWKPDPSNQLWIENPKG